MNGSQLLPINIADVVRTAATVGGPVQGTALDKSMRRAGIMAITHSALVGFRRNQSLQTTQLYQELETTEKSGVSFRLGMAFAVIACEHVLGVKLLEHLNRANSLLATGSQRRADLFGIGHSGECHVVEAKSRTYGLSKEAVDRAKEQALNIKAVLRNGNALIPDTRSASIADLSRSPISIFLIDPEPRQPPKASFEIDLEQFIADHYSVVPDLLEIYGEPQAPPENLPMDAIGAYLPGTNFWLGIDPSLIERSSLTWQERLEQREALPLDVAKSPELSVGTDGHVLHLGNHLSHIYRAWDDSPERASEEEN
ncbi:MAG: hypothetical protein M3335_05810 [Actinomycetota bacterium]|nr:hypothetical protein [Actinomycetota bacterium]